MAEVQQVLEFYNPEKAKNMGRIPILSFLSGIFSTKVLIETQIKDKNMSISDCSINHAPSVKLSTMEHIGESITFLQMLLIVCCKTFLTSMYFMIAQHYRDFNWQYSTM